MKSIRTFLALSLLFFFASCSSTEQNSESAKDSTQKDTINTEHNPAAATPSNGQF